MRGTILTALRQAGMVAASAGRGRHGMQNDLIFDLGLHAGVDTAFYLAKGFRVVAVEANPALAEAARQRFATAIAERRLVVVAAAIAAHAGTVPFFRNAKNSEWGTIDAGFAARNAQFGAASERIDVPATTFAALIAQHGVPCYVKIDIEGADTLCIAALEGLADRPRLVSFESGGPRRFADTLQAIACLDRCGYRSFQLVNQARHRRVRLPQPPREGRWVEHRFKNGSSGPFGAELPGRWLPLDAFLRGWLRTLRAEDRWSINGRGAAWRVKLRTRLERWRLCPPFGWFDIHARLQAPDGSADPLDPLPGG